MPLTVLRLSGPFMLRAMEDDRMKSYMLEAQTSDSHLEVHPIHCYKIVNMD